MENDMSDLPFKNTYGLSQDQLQALDEAEEAMEVGRLNDAESLFLAMLKEDEDCVPVLANLGHLHGRHFSEYDKAVEYYDRVLLLEPDNAWARDERRKYKRWLDSD